MKNLFDSTAYMGAFLSLGVFFLGKWIQKKTKISICNPLLIAIVCIILFLKCSGIEYDAYYQGAEKLQFFLTPATICLAVPLYRKLELLKKNAFVILISIFAGTISSFISVFVICTLVGSSHDFFVSMLPKSITTAIGMGVCEELGGIVTITVAVIIVTGIVGSILCDVVFRFFHISNPVAQGIALGTSAHAIGTSKALSMGEVQGAMSSLSIAVAGVLTVILAPLAQNWIV